MKKLGSWTITCIILAAAPIGMLARVVSQPGLFASQPADTQTREVRQLLDDVEAKVAAVEAAITKGAVSHAHPAMLAEARRLLDFIEQEASHTLKQDEALAPRIKALRDRITALQPKALK